jgi:hypothetical protein
MSTPQGGSNSAKPGAVRITGKSATAGGKPAGGATSARKATSTATPGARKATPGGTRPGAGGGKGGGKRPITPIKVNQQRNWMPIIIGIVVGAIALGIVGYAVWNSTGSSSNWQAKADKIKGIQDYRKSNPTMLEYTQHETGVITYPMHPPVGGTHNPEWQRCAGDVYPAAIADEHAVHSMEHGAVWITYRPDLPADQVRTLAAKVTGNNFMLMSPYPNLNAPISVQTWGFQLKVNSASDPRIDQFITDLREVSSKEPGAVCDSGSYITATGTTPHNIDNAPSAPAAASPSSSK